MKTSIDDLPDDSPESRLTKAVFRRIWARKAELGLTTAEIARRFSTVSPSSEISTSTMNGIFAGKRKSITVYEILVFAQLLGCAPSDLCPEVADAGQMTVVREKVRRELIQELLANT